MPPVLREFRSTSQRVLAAALSTAYPSRQELAGRLDVPPTFEFGELSSSCAFQIAREIGGKPVEVAEKIHKAMAVEKGGLLYSVEVAGGGYLNFRLDYDLATTRIISDVLKEANEYGFLKSSRPVRAVVEHTSANPNGPLHLGHVRNTMLGDTIARILRKRGHEVRTRFYIDDTGKQVAILAYGYDLVGRPTPKGKADHWLGSLYACTNCAIEIQATKTQLDSLDANDDAFQEARQKLSTRLSDWTSVAQELRASDHGLFDQVVEAVQKIPDVSGELERFTKSYESHSPDVVELVRHVAQLCLDGQRATLNRVAVGFDEWDWESDVVWGKEVETVLSQLAGTQYVERRGGSLVLQSEAILDAFALRGEFGLTLAYDIPPLTLTRSDGTSLYATRDVAYTLRKFHDAERVINVVGAEQKLPQLHLRLALVALGKKDLARNLAHYSYGLVELEGMKMSRRRGRFITFDELIDQAVNRAKAEVEKRQHELGQHESQSIAETVALGAIRYSMLNVSSTKNITFSWDRVLSLERNSAPFINYAYTRAISILRKLGGLPSTADVTVLREPLEKWLVYRLGSFPLVFEDAADSLRPEDLATFANSLAEKFHEYYEKFAVLRAESENLKHARAQLVGAVGIVLRNCMDALGIRLSEKM